jgi:predicted AAA+ superfamily ATPase
MRPWREVVAPHTDVLEGTFQQAEFAADITAVQAGKATHEYQDPAAFYQRTFITDRIGDAQVILLQRMSASSS